MEKKPSLQVLKINPEETFESYWVKSNSFGFHWHYHPEIELCYIKKGQGTRMVGDSVNEFEEGDLVLLGTDLPHTWISQSYNNQQGDNVQAFVIQFSIDLIPTKTLNHTAFSMIKLLLQKAQKGINFKDSEKYLPLLDKINNATNVKKYLVLINLLEQFSQDVNTELLTSRNYSPILSGENRKRMLNVFGYIHANFTEKITLEAIAAIACLNEASFCRYFKKNTGQNFKGYINDLKINHACQMLVHKDQSILSIASLVGFNSYTNFNKCFVNRKKISPSVFRNKYSNSK